MTEPFSAIDRVRMARALHLASRPLNGCDPNPRVGCVIDRGGEVVGEGWHKRAGEAHAEVAALAAAAGNARGATAYVTLEPCCHQGRTGPCSEALIAAGIARVVFAVGDPDPKVDGGGAAALSAAGIAVESGLLEQPAREINRGFFHRHKHHRPFVTSKIASSLDGRTALSDGTSKWITGDAARDDVQRLRARSSAILTGIETVLADDPSLTVRLTDKSGWQMPLRVIADSQLRTPATAKMLTLPGQTLVLTGCNDEVRTRHLAEAGAEVIRVATGSEGRIDLVAALKLLGDRGVNELMVEAGATLNGALYRQSLIDELVVYQAPVLLGTTARSLLDIGAINSMDQRAQLQLQSLRRVGNDWRLRLRPRNL